MGKVCYDKRVLGGLAVVGLAIFVVSPGLLFGALPLLLVAACPLSMLLMGKAMMGGGRKAVLGQREAPLDLATGYTCPMHPDVAANGPGRCSRCGMNLVPMSTAPVIDAPFRTGPGLGPAEQAALLHVQLQRLGEQQAALAQQLAQLHAIEATTAPHVSMHEREQRVPTGATRS